MSQSVKRSSPIKNLPPPAKKDRPDDNIVEMTLYSMCIQGNLELIWCEKDPQQDGFTQPLATDLLSQDQTSITSRYNIFMYGSRRMNQFGRVQFNRDDSFPRRYYVRMLRENETRSDRLSVIHGICNVSDWIKSKARSIIYYCLLRQQKAPTLYFFSPSP